MVRPLFKPSRVAQVPPSEPEDLNRLGKRIDEAGRKHAESTSQGAAPSPLGIAFRFGAEMISALLVGGAFGWGIDWAFDHWAGVHTRPWGLVVMFVLGAAAGIRNVMRAAQQINAEMASKEK
jgi:ATP synthase protein I